MTTLKVSSKSKPNSVAGAIAGSIRDNNVVEIETIGAGAVNQAVKAIAIARGYLAPTGIDIVCQSAFREITVDGAAKTGIVLTVEKK